MPSKRQPPSDPATLAYQAGVSLVAESPLFGLLLRRAALERHDRYAFPADGWAIVDCEGTILLHPTRRGEPAEWAYVIAHCLLHLAFGHHKAPDLGVEWRAACDLTVNRFLQRMKFGKPPSPLTLPTDVPGADERRLTAEWRANGIPEPFTSQGTAGSRPDLVEASQPRWSWGRPVDWEVAFAEGLRQAVSDAVNLAGGRRPTRDGFEEPSAAQRARSWFINSYPMLGSLAASFTIIEDPVVCRRLEVSIAAINGHLREIYVNPAVGLSEEECRFVLAHELLHAGLAHAARRKGRDPFLWNVACDYVINGWQVEMGVGLLPAMGLLHDADLAGLSAEAIYERIATDLRRARKLATLRGAGLGDIVEEATGGDVTDLDAFYRRALSQGLVYHELSGRGLLPAGLVEEIRALSMPPIAWDVELARWFDSHFAPVAPRRSYARLSRRQSATPDIARPAWSPPVEPEDLRTFGVVLDTSGSMSRTMIAQALGSIASYSISHEVPAVRVVFCDATTYDQGYLLPEDIASSVRVTGRGGTVLQPAITLLETAGDFPADGPILIITDGQCDRLRVRRDHAFLMPEGATLPFAPAGPIFWLTDRV